MLTNTIHEHKTIHLSSDLNIHENRHNINMEDKDILNFIGSKSRYSDDIINKQYHGLCISSGGINGILELGAINEFWLRDQIQNIKYYSGSSSGSIIISLIAIGYSPVEIFVNACSPDFASKFDNLNLMNLPNIFGLFPSSVLRNKLEQMFIFKLGYLPTFLELYLRCNKYIIIPIYCLSDHDIKKRKIYCSPENTPDMKIIDAVVISCGVPIIFQKNIYKNKTYIDGAYTSTFPIKILQEKAYTNCPILGIFMEDSESDLSTFIGYSTSILEIPLRDQDNLDHINVNTDVIEIKNQSKLSVNFSMGTNKKILMFTKAGGSILSFLEKVKNKNEQKEEKIYKVVEIKQKYKLD